MHGKASRITHDGAGVYAGLPKTVEVGRYHSLSIEPGRIPPASRSPLAPDDGEIMGIRHREIEAERATIPLGVGTACGVTEIPQKQRQNCDCVPLPDSTILGSIGRGPRFPQPS